MAWTMPTSGLCSDVMTEQSSLSIRSGTEGPCLTWSHVKLHVLHRRPPRPYLSAPGQLQDLGAASAHLNSLPG